MKNLIILKGKKVIFSFIAIFLVTSAALAEDSIIKIGVLAKRGPERCIEKWSPTAEYLSNKIPEKTFVIVPVDYDRIYSVVEKSEVDFILANPSFYVELENWYGIKRIATLKNKVLSGIYTKYGGVVFCKKQREDIRQYGDLKGKAFMAVKETSFGGWRMAWRELKEAGIDPFKDFASMSFGGTHDAVVYAVRDGKVDAGTVRTDTLESMDAEGEINIDDFHVIHEHVRGFHFPFLHSTRKYPEWPIAKLKHTSNEVAEKVAVALIGMPQDSAAAQAAGYAGWTIPLNYQSVHECLQELKVGPYKDFGKITTIAVFRKYWLLILIDLAALIVLAWFLTARIKHNRKLKAAHGELQSEVDERKRAEEKVKHLNAVLRAIRNINKLIVTEKDRDRLIKSVCDNFIATRGYYDAWIALFDESGNFVAAAEGGLDETFSRLLEVFKRGDLVSCAKKAFEQSGVLALDNPLEACRDCPLAEHYGDRAAMSIRLEYEDKTYGMMSVSIPKGMATDREEQLLFEEAANDIAFALHVLESEEKERQSQEALRESEEFNKKIIESSNDSLKTLDLDGRLEFMSEGGQKLMEIEDIGPYLNQSWTDFWQGTDRKAALEAISKARDGDTGYFAGCCPTEKGTEKWWDIIITPIIGRDGKVERLLAVSRDITERKKLETQLRQAQKMEAIGTLAGGVAHDFNNLLTTIIGNAQFALMDVDKDSPLRDEIEEILKASGKATALTRQLLAFGRKQIINPEVLDINEAIRDSEKMLRRLITENIIFLTVLEPEPWKVYADAGQIEQVFMNLVVNARDAMPEGGKLTIETANVELDETYFRDRGVENKPGPYVMLAVTDNGIGMDEEIRSQIFDPFFTTKEKGVGTGLGLSTVYGIVKQSQGYIWVYSEPGKGTSIKVYLPRAEGDPEAVREEKEPTVEVGGSETVMIAEDDDSLRKMVKKVLHKQGYRILDAQNGEEALKIAEEYEGDIHLVLIDVVMPGMDGKELAEHIESLHPDVKVLYMSGHTENAIVHHGVLQASVNFIQKPFTQETLARKVREALDAR